MRDAGLCLNCAAFRGPKSGAERCMAMTPGCPVPEYLKTMWRRTGGGAIKPVLETTKSIYD